MQQFENGTPIVSTIEAFEDAVRDPEEHGPNTETRQSLADFLGNPTSRKEA